MNAIAYRDGYKYQLCEPYETQVPVRPPDPVQTEYLQLSPAGRLTIMAGYAWDGPSGPTWDSPCAMRGSLIHDALYQLIREGFVGTEWREIADHCLYTACVEDGMLKMRAWGWYLAVRWAAGPAARPSARKPVKYAP